MTKQLINVAENKQIDNFGKKVKLLGLDTNKQIELLNKIYPKDVCFKIFGDEIEISVSDKIRQLTIPDIAGEYNLWIRCGENVSKLDLPKTLKSLKDCLIVGHNLKTLCIWDTTEFDYDALQNSARSELKYLVIKSESGKNKVFHVN